MLQAHAYVRLYKADRCKELHKEELPRGRETADWSPATAQCDCAEPFLSRSNTEPFTRLGTVYTCTEPFTRFSVDPTPQHNATAQSRTPNGTFDSQEDHKGESNRKNDKML